jgi:hypothetical protein
MALATDACPHTCLFGGTLLVRFSIRILFSCEKKILYSFKTVGQKGTDELCMGHGFKKRELQSLHECF